MLRSLVCNFPKFPFSAPYFPSHASGGSGVFPKKFGIAVSEFKLIFLA
jgi:hypothetical protein